MAEKLKNITTDDLFKLRGKGKTNEDIAKDLGIPVEAIEFWIKGYLSDKTGPGGGRQGRRPRRECPDVKKLVKMRIKDRATLRDLATEFGVSNPTITAWLEDAQKAHPDLNLSRRGRSESRTDTECPDKKKLKKLRIDDHLTVAAIAEKFGVSKYFVNIWLKALQKEMPELNWPKKARMSPGLPLNCSGFVRRLAADRLRKMCEDFNVLEIAEHYSYSRETVSQAMDALDIPRESAKKDRVLAPRKICTNPSLLMSLREWGQTEAEIAARFNVGIGTAKRWIREYLPEELHSPVSTSFATTVDLDELKRVYFDEEWTIEDISEHFGVTGLTIYKALDHHDLGRRPRKNRPKNHK